MMTITADVNLFGKMIIIKAMRYDFKVDKQIRVTFFKEAGVDVGGPGREFFMGEIANNSSLLDGPPDRRVLRHNISALQVSSSH